MARLVSLFLLLLLAACHLDELEEFAVPRHRSELSWSALDAQMVAAECEGERAKLRAAHRYRPANAKSDQAYMEACTRELTIMRAYGRR